VPLESPHESKKQPSALKERTSDGWDLEGKQQQKARASANESAEQETPAAEASESASDPASQKYWSRLPDECPS
jgi:hypothetical protein